MKSELLKDKMVIVAGGCGRLGAAFTTSILDNGGFCVVTDINESHGAELVANLALTGYESKIEFCTVDISDSNSLDKLIDKVGSKHNHIDAFVNTSYPHNSNWGKKFFEDVALRDFCENASLHLGGFFLAAQKICSYFKKQGYGNIIQIASIQGIMAPKFDTYKGSAFNGSDMNSPAEYSIFKAGIINLTRYLAKYYKGYNIRSNCISPGGIYSGQPEKFIEKYNKYCLSKGMLNAEDISGTLIYLLSDMSKYVNGQNIIVDDGWSL
jgi:NAD(P)-dependent dehydrogenase (short-subunit alcohol dehydrogenase family)